MGPPNNKKSPSRSKSAFQVLISATFLWLLHQRSRGVTFSYPDLTYDKQGSRAVTTVSLPNATAALYHMAAKLRQKVSPTCPVKQFGTGYGRHMLCDNPPPKRETCWFYSFGIQKDYSFDTDLADQWGCLGFAADPTVVHPSQLHQIGRAHV